MTFDEDEAEAFKEAERLAFLLDPKPDRVKVKTTSPEYNEKYGKKYLVECWWDSYGRAHGIGVTPRPSWPEEAQEGLQDWCNEVLLKKKHPFVR